MHIYIYICILYIHIYIYITYIYLLIDERALVPSNKSFKMHFAAFIVLNHNKKREVLCHINLCNIFILTNFCNLLIDLYTSLIINIYFTKLIFK